LVVYRIKHSILAFRKDGSQPRVWVETKVVVSHIGGGGFSAKESNLNYHCFFQVEVRRIVSKPTRQHLAIIKLFHAMNQHAGGIANNLCHSVNNPPPAPTPDPAAVLSPSKGNPAIVFLDSNLEKMLHDISVCASLTH
jgi:hypothetical protein